MSIENFVLFQISHKMVKLGLTPDDVFNIIDADGGGTLDQDELLLGLKRNLDVMLPD